MDESSRFVRSDFADADTANGYCRRIVYEYPASELNGRDGQRYDRQCHYDNYGMFGEDPYARSIRLPVVSSSASDYAKVQCAVSCGVSGYN